MNIINICGLLKTSNNNGKICDQGPSKKINSFELKKAEIPTTTKSKDIFFVLQE